LFVVSPTQGLSRERERLLQLGLQACRGTDGNKNIQKYNWRVFSPEFATPGNSEQNKQPYLRQEEVAGLIESEHSKNKF
jgi:hypothetical protein